MIYIKNKFFNHLFLFILFLTISSSTFADKTDIDFSVSIKPSNFHVGEDFSYFNLAMEPKEEDALSLLISNNGQSDLDLIISPINATTNQEGLIDYSKKDKQYKYDSSLKVPFTSLVSEEQLITLKPNEQRAVTFDLKMPESPIEGTVLGGIIVSPKDKEDNRKKKKNKTGDIQFKNKFEIRKAVIINDEKNTQTPELKLTNVQQKLVNNIPATTVNIQNINPVMFGDLTIETQIINKKNNKVVKEQINESVEMAPNSNFDLPIYWNNQRLENGNYTLNISAYSGTKTWNLSQDFDVTKKNSLAFDDYYKDHKTIETPLWLKIVIYGSVTLGVLILVGSLFIYYKTNKQKKTSKKKNKSKKKYIKRKHTP